MYTELTSAEEKLLKLIVENTDRNSNVFSFSTLLLPPELRLYKDALNSLTLKGYVYKEMPVLRAVSGYVTDEGLSYFVEKEQYNQVRIIQGEARELLIELIENKDSDLAGFLASKFNGLDFAQDTRLRNTISFLIKNGYLVIPQNGWADDVPHFATLTYEGEHYLQVESEKLRKTMEQRDMKSQISITNHGQLNMASDNSTIIATQTNGLDITNLHALMGNLKKFSKGLDAEDAQSLKDCLDILQDEALKPQPKKSFLRTAINTLKGINGSVEFAAAVVAIIQFLEPVLS